MCGDEDVRQPSLSLESVLHSDIKLLPLPTEDRQPGCYFFNEWSTNRSLYELFESIFPKVAGITGDPLLFCNVVGEPKFSFS